MKKVALVTGGTSGIGLAVAQSLKKKGYTVYEVSRRAEGPKGVTHLVGDVTQEAQMQAVVDEIIEKEGHIDLLVNNAGFGAYGKVDEIDIAKQTNMIDLNVKALTKITYYALDFMSEGSKIINTASIVAFAPTPNMASYSATKTYVMSFSRALRHELRKRKINVTAVCPGPMATEFFTVAGVENDQKSLINKLPMCDANKVATKGIKAAKRGKAVYTPRALYKFLRVVGKTVPHTILIKFISA